MSFSVNPTFKKTSKTVYIKATQEQCSFIIIVSNEFVSIHSSIIVFSAITAFKQTQIMYILKKLTKFILSFSTTTFLHSLIQIQSLIVQLRSSTIVRTAVSVQ